MLTRYSLKNVLSAIGAAGIVTGAAFATDLPWVYENVDRPATTVIRVSSGLGSRFVTDLLQDVSCSQGANIHSFEIHGLMLIIK